MIQHLISTDEPDAWEHRALCAQVDPELFFPEKGGSSKEAKGVCAACDVRDECLEAALLEDDHHGVRGGYTERERRRIKRGLPVAVAPERSCEHCGETFQPRHKDARFCTSSCAGRAHHARQDGAA